MSVTPAGHTEPVPRVAAGELTPQRLEALATPLVVEDWQTPPRELPTAALAAWLGETRLWVYARNVGDAWQEWQAAQFLDAFGRDDADPGLNVVDVYLPEPRFDAVFPVHPALDAANLLIRDARTAHYRRSVVLTAAGAYTPMHVDSYGCGGWMYLISGEKHWELVDASEAARLWDPHKGDWADPRANGWPADVPSWTATLRAGEMMICPPGFVHRVATPSRCVGFGGAYLTAAHSRRALAIWRREQDLGVAGPLALDAVLTAIAQAAEPETAARLWAALA